LRFSKLTGYAIPVTDDEEKLWAMEKITNSVVDEQWVSLYITTLLGTLQGELFRTYEGVKSSQIIALQVPKLLDEAC
jgi:hypothetical protein